MRITALLFTAAVVTALPNLQKRAAQFTQGEPIDANGKGAPIDGMFRLYKCVIQGS